MDVANANLVITWVHITSDDDQKVKILIYFNK